MTPLWQILIASVYRRDDLLNRLLDQLRPQLAPYCGSVTVLVDRDDCQQPIGVKRTRLLETTTARYTCFADDDDQVADNYVQRIVDALLRGPDYVGFRLEYSVDGVVQKPVYHTLECDEWWEDDRAYYRNVSHLNPIRRDAALTGLPFLPGFGEDRDWATKVRASGLVRDEVYLGGSPMYFYEYRSEGSLFPQPELGATGAAAPAWLERPYVELLS